MISAPPGFSTRTSTATRASPASTVSPSSGPSTRRHRRRDCSTSPASTRRSYPSRTSGQIAPISLDSIEPTHNPKASMSQRRPAPSSQRRAASSAERKNTPHSTSDRPLMYPTASVIIGCSPKVAAVVKATTVALTGRRADVGGVSGLLVLDGATREMEQQQHVEHVQPHVGEVVTHDAAAGDRPIQRVAEIDDRAGHLPVDDGADGPDVLDRRVVEDGTEVVVGEGVVEGVDVHQRREGRRQGGQPPKARGS